MVDDSTSFRAVLVPASAEIREDIGAELPRVRAIGKSTAPYQRRGHVWALAAEGRVLLAFAPDRPPSSWTAWGLD